jgi:hypothetical protein
MLYASETWNTLSAEVARLDSLQYQKFLLLLCLNWKDKWSYTQLVKIFARYGAAVDTITIMVSFRLLRFVKHIERGDYVNLKKIILHVELGQEVRPVGKPE